ncbi:MAG: vanadium-dependent haloperoxidase [Reichenbachiella sp.]
MGLLSIKGTIKMTDWSIHHKKLIFLIGFVIVCFSSCEKPFDEEGFNDFSKDQLNVWNKVVTDIMVHDIFSPPVASRIYAYPNIAAYEILALESESHPALSSKIQHQKDIPKPKQQSEYNASIASVIAYSMVAEQLVYSFEVIQEMRSVYLEKVRSFGISERVIKNSVDHGVEVADQILEWANSDGYRERNVNSQIIKDVGEGTWTPTPPDFIEPIEPNWNTLRTFIIDSASQFQPGEPTEFDKKPSSLFYKECMEVYEAVRNADNEKIEIAQFWDCNPNASNHSGHVMKFVQKISPGAHWVLIASQISREKNLSLIERAKVFSHLSIALADGFISCWSEKYRTVVIRPETYINRYIDKDWQPILQTPPFPEYTSGHSVASGAAAKILTAMLGENVSFNDSTELDFGLPVRSFTSFNQAADEAAISRLYGGIHYMPAITNGVEQGRLLGDFVSARLLK